MPVQPLYMLFLLFICPKLCVLVPVYLYFFIVLEVSAGMDLGGGGPPAPPQIHQFSQVNFQFFKGMPYNSAKISILDVAYAYGGQFFEYF